MKSLAPGEVRYIKIVDWNSIKYQYNFDISIWHWFGQGWSRTWTMLHSQDFPKPWNDDKINFIWTGTEFIVE